MAVRRLAPAQQPNRSRLARHEKQRRRFADVDPVAVGRERIAARGTHEIERRKTGHGERAQ